MCVKSVVTQLKFVATLILQDIVHGQSFRQERQRYYTNHREAIENPRDSISVIVDGMDQNKTNLPHLTRIPKSCQNLWSLRSHLTGVKVHGGGVYCYIMTFFNGPTIVTSPFVHYSIP